MYCMYSIAHIFTNTSFKLWRNWVSPRPKIFITWPSLREYEAKIWGKQRRLLSHATLTSSHCCTQTTKLGQLAKMSFTLPPLFNVFPFCQLERERDLGGKNSLKTPYILQYGNLKTFFWAVIQWINHIRFQSKLFRQGFFKLPNTHYYDGNHWNKWRIKAMLNY